jgi:hypothetical protein
MAIDLTPNNQQIKPKNMAKYPDHAEWPYESLRTITEMFSPSKAVDTEYPNGTYLHLYGNTVVKNKVIIHGKYGDPIEQNTELYKHDIAMGFAAAVTDDDYDIFMPQFYILECRSSGNAAEICSMRHTPENKQFVEKLLVENKIKVPPQYQYYRDSPGSLDLCLKFESKEDADAWKLAKTKEAK